MSRKNRSLLAGFLYGSYSALLFLTPSSYDTFWKINLSFILLKSCCPLSVLVITREIPLSSFNSGLTSSIPQKSPTVRSERFYVLGLTLIAGRPKTDILNKQLEIQILVAWNIRFCTVPVNFFHLKTIPSIPVFAAKVHWQYFCVTLAFPIFDILSPEFRWRRAVADNIQAVQRIIFFSQKTF